MNNLQNQNQNQNLNQTNLENNETFTIITLSVPIPIQNKSGFKSAIVSSFITNKFSINSDKILTTMKSLNLNKFIIVYICDNPEVLKSLHRKKYYNQFSVPCKFILLIFGYEDFFSYSTFEYFFDEKKGQLYEHIFVFENRSWQKICALFALTSVDISGGSNNKKHLLSPLQHRLSQFLICLYGCSDSSIEVKTSFHRNMIEEDKKMANYSGKKSQNLIIDFAKSNKIIKSRLLADSSLIKQKDHLIKDKIKDQDNGKRGNEIDSDQSQCQSHSDDNINNNENHTKKYHNNYNLNNSEVKVNESYQQNENKTIKQLSPQIINHSNGIRRYHISASLFNSNNQITPVPKLEDTLIDQYLNSVKDIIEGTIDSDDNKKREAQQKFENIWINLIENKINDDDFFINRNQNILFSAIFSAKETLETMEDHNYLKKKFPQLGSELNKIEYIILTFSLCISLYSRLSYNALAVKVGQEIVYYIYKIKYLKNRNKKKNKEILITYEEFKNLNNIDLDITLKLGDFFMNIIQQFPHDIFARKIKLDSYYSNEPYILEINKEYLKPLKENIIINPNHLPMICSPNEWSNDFFGGYLTNESREVDIITNMDKISHKVENKSSVYLTVNYLNSIKFGVNNLLLDYITSSEGKYLLEEIKPDDPLQRVVTLKVAQIFSKVYFYLSTHADWRGRIYTQSFYLSYQSGDLSTSLLNFWEGEPINGEGKFYLYIYGANSHNQNKIGKASFNDRINWVNKNYDKIIKLDKELILSAENPFVFTAFCLNMREIHNNPNAIIKTPVFLDATCSGIQHLAALMKDLELGTNTNLIESTNEEKPGDIYDRLLEPINNAINKFGEENIEFSMLSLVKLTRKEVKNPIMTKVYNVTVFGISNQLQSIFKIKDAEKFKNEFYNKPMMKLKHKFEESLKFNKYKTKFICPGKDGKDVLLKDEEVYKIAKIINDQIFVVFPSLNNIYNYFIDLTNLSIKLGIAITWITPSGLKITQNYLKKKKRIISVSIFGKSKKLVIKENENKLDINKQTQSIIPNIIHSLDASHLMNIIKNAIIDKFNPVITIHDCFGTLPNHMGNLEYRVKKEFVLIYLDNKFLKDYNQRFYQNLKDNQFEIITFKDKSYVKLENELLEIPTVPQLGKLDIENIMKSKYMIS